MVNWHKYGKIASSKNKQKILLALNRPKTPTELSKEIGTARSTCSQTLIELEKLGLAECLSPKLRMGRVYGLTKEGRNILGLLNQK